nr:hypothetical protein [uncultured Campylobacter sp.]
MSKKIVLVDNAKNGEVLGYKVLGTDEILKEIKIECANAIVAVGQIKSAKIRIYLFNKLKELGFNLPVIISPLAYVSKHASIGASTAVMHYGFINAGASVIKADVSVKDQVFFGSNFTTKNGVIIEQNSKEQNTKNSVIIEQNSLIPMASSVKLGGGSTKK